MPANKKRSCRAALLSQIRHPFVQHLHARWFYQSKMDAHPRARMRECHPSHPGDDRAPAHNPQSELSTLRKWIRRFDETSKHRDVFEMRGQVRLRLQVSKFDARRKRVARRAMVVGADGKRSRLWRILCQASAVPKQKKHFRWHTLNAAQCVN